MYDNELKLSQVKCKPLTKDEIEPQCSTVTRHSLTVELPVLSLKNIWVVIVIILAVIFPWLNDQWS